MYVALYRKWRPKNFANIVGQEHLVRALRNQVQSGRVAHAYLFTGPRGTGKTSTARVFARAINCLTPIQGEPCGSCAACLALAAENNLDIIEIDAASNNGVDEIRDLRERVKFPPTSCAYKVYIIDEVHMLSAGAFNALLKTLEEPPAHAVFLLATTEAHKLPATILSRCQRYDFARIATTVIADLLHKVLDESPAQFSDEAILLIARSAEGGMRDALSIADMCLAYCEGGHIEYDDVARLIGSADRSALFALADAIIAADPAASLRCIDTISASGRDMTVLTRDLTEHFRDLMIVSQCARPEEVLDVANDVLEGYRRQTQAAGTARILYCLDTLASVEAQMKYSPRPRTVLEATAVRLCRPEVSASLEAIEARLEAVEQAIRQGVPAASAATPATAPSVSATSKKPDNPPAQTVQAQPAPQPTIQEQPKEAAAPTFSGTAQELWRELKTAIKAKSSMLYMMLQETEDAVLEGKRLTISFPESMKPNYDFASGAERIKLIEEVTRERLGAGANVTLRMGKGTQPKGLDADEQLKLAQQLFGTDSVILKKK